MKKTAACLATGLLLFGLAGNAQAGKIVLANDEWTLSNSYFGGVNDAGVFATNVASWFTDGDLGNFLVYSTNFGLTGSLLSSTMTGAGHSWQVSTGISFDLDTLLNYDGIFLAGNAADNSVLTDYVNEGGNVYLAGGTGDGGAANEAARWNTFLNNFGLGFGATYNGLGGSIAINSNHLIFSDVDHLYQNNGNDALDLAVSGDYAQILVSQNGHGLYAVYESPAPAPAPVPEPATMLLFGTGIAGLAGSRIRRKLKM